ncbi:MAG TPA: alpha/beta fold hydrolase [Gaiellaceae bacterium]|nr:alpha/beta fold hydrolase [Gaiellaceae bacterium]
MTDLLASMYRLFTWRIASHVPYWDLEQIRGEVGSWEEWLPTWCRWAERHVALGDEALAQGRRLTAGEAYVRAGLFYHWGTFVSVEDPDAFRAALEAGERAWTKAAPLVDPPMELVDVPFEGTTLPGYLRRPHGVARPPLAVLVPGADSTKEELYDLSEHLVRRGIAAFAFDGPGHGLVSFRLTLRPDEEVAVVAVLDALLGRDDLDADRVAVVGISYGGLFAIRTAAVDARVLAAVSMSSWYSSEGRYATQDPISKAGLKQYMGDDPAAVQDQLTVAGYAERVRVPVLQVYGAQDPASPPEQAERTAAELGGPSELVVYEEGVHVANNVPYRSRAVVADWLAERLDARV